jgi:hypothetical protein
MKKTSKSPLHKRQSKGTKKDFANKLFKVLYNEPMSRRMAITKLGFADQTYMVTQLIYDWIKQGKAQVIGKIKCQRSGLKVEKVTTNPELFISKNTNLLNLFE